MTYLTVTLIFRLIIVPVSVSVDQTKSKPNKNKNRTHGTEKNMGERSTLVRTPPVDESKAPIENALELTELSINGPVSEVAYADTHLYLPAHDARVPTL